MELLVVLVGTGLAHTRNTQTDMRISSSELTSEQRGLIHVY